MKKKIILALLMAIVLMVFDTAIAAAGETKVQLDGVYVNLEPAPMIVDGRTLLPARAIVEMLGGDIDWDNDLRQVHINHDGTHILLTIDNDVAYVNGVPETLDVPPQIIDGRTLVPLRFVVESLGVDVDFQDGTIFINTSNITMVTSRDFVLSDGTNLTILYTPVVRRGSDATVVILEGPAEALWNLSIRYASGDGTASGLGEQFADEEGHAEWSWRIGNTTTIGDWPVTISGNGESLSFYISIVTNE